MSYRPSPVETWLFEAATDHDDRLSGPLVIGGLRLRRVLDDAAGTLPPETVRYGWRQLSASSRLGGPCWTRTCQAVARAAEPLGFGLSPRWVEAFGDPPAWVQAYSCCADFKAQWVATHDPEWAVPPPTTPLSVEGLARSIASS